MHDLKPTWTDEQVLEVNGRAVRLYNQLATEIPVDERIKQGVYQGILNQCGQVELPQIAQGTILPRMDQIREKR